MRKMHRTTKKVAISLLVAGALMAGGTTAASAVEETAAEEAEAPVVEEQIPVMPEGTGTSAREVSTAAICVAVNRVDYPHISNTSSELAVQAHGNWDRGTCNAELADVTTQIDRKNPIGLFQAVGEPGKDRLAYNPKGLKSGGPGRVTAQYPCNGTAEAPFRAWTNIDMVGIADTQTRTYSPDTDPIACG